MTGGGGKRTKAERAFLQPGRTYLHSLQTSRADPELAGAQYVVGRLIQQLAEANPTVSELQALARNTGVQKGKLPRPAGTPVVTKLASRVERACALSGVQPLPAVAAGPLRERGLQAVSHSVFLSSALIAVSQGFMTFANLFGKAVAPLVARRSGDGVLFGRRPKAEDRAPALERFRELMAAVCLRRDPATAPRYVPPPAWPFWNAAGLLRDSIEFFTLAHEYTHLLVAHDHIRIEGDDDAQPSAEAHEAVADVFALSLAVFDRSSRAPLAMRVMAPLLLMKIVGIMQTEGLHPSDGEHPPAVDRLVYLKEALPDIARRAGRDRAWASATLAEVAKTERLLEEAWQEVRGDLERAAIQGALTPEVTAEMLTDLLTMAGVPKDLLAPASWVPDERERPSPSADGSEQGGNKP